MKHILFIMCIFTLIACGGGSDNGNESSSVNAPSDNTETFTLQNIRFDAIDYYEGEQITVTKGTSFEVQWVSPIAEPYRIDLYLSTNGDAHSDRNKVVGIRCGSDTFSLCPNPTGEVQCTFEDNNLSCAIGSTPVGSKNFLTNDLSNLTFIVKGCDALTNCDVKTFTISVQNTNDE